MRKARIKSIVPVENEPLSALTLEITENGIKNKKRLIEKRKAWHKEHYKPRLFKRRTPEELKEYRKKYYQEHKEYYKQKNKEYYEKHKNDETFRERHNEATKKYLQKRREKGEKWWIKEKN